MPPNQNSRLELGWATLEGLSVGDALGEALSYGHANARERSKSSMLSKGSIRFTDDTAMAIGIIECLKLCDAINEDALAWIFGKNFAKDPDRGYRKMTRRILSQISEGTPWQSLASAAFGRGSFGNGSAMRVGPVGAYFHDDLEKVRLMATASARVTHAHPEGIAGAIAVAIATAVATRSRSMPVGQAAGEIWQAVLSMTPDGRTAKNLRLAHSFSPDRNPNDVAKAVGCGYDVSCQDTVPFAIWNACRCLHDFQEAVLSTVEVGGDCDTNAAIVGGIVASYGTSKTIPETWVAACESLPTNIKPNPEGKEAVCNAGS